METYFDEAFTEDEAKAELKKIFGIGCCTLGYGFLNREYTEFRLARIYAFNELFNQLVDSRFPKLCEMKSLGMVQKYLEKKLAYEKTGKKVAHAQIF